MLTHQPKTSFPAPPTTPQPAVQDQLVRALQDRIRRVETAKRVGSGETISSGCLAIDRLLPEQGYSPGTLVQWLTPGGYGADYLSLRTAIEACRNGGALVVLDPDHQFYPPAVAALGFNMGNLIVLRSPKTSRSRAPSSSQSVPAKNDLFWAIDQALRCSAVGAVWGPIGSIDERWFRRFQLSAESSGCLGLFIQSTQAAQQPSWAEVQWLVTGSTATSLANQEQPKKIQPTTIQPKKPSNPRPPENTRQHRVRLQLTRCRSTQTGQSITVSINALTGEVN
jgi:hypothetical protein